MRRTKTTHLEGAGSTTAPREAGGRLADRGRDERQRLVIETPEPRRRVDEYVAAVRDERGGFGSRFVVRRIERERRRDPEARPVRGDGRVVVAVVRGRVAVEDVAFGAAAQPPLDDRGARERLRGEFRVVR